MKEDVVVNESRIYKRCWIDEIQDRAYDCIKEEDKIPMVVVSYNRPDMKVKNIIYKGENWEAKHWPIYVLVRETQRELYENAVGERIKVITAQDDLINSCGKAKNYVLHNFDKAFIFDDDIEVFDRAYYEVHPKEDKTTIYSRTLLLHDKERLGIKEYNICDILAMWQLCFDYARRLNDRVVSSSIGVMGRYFTPNYIDINNSLSWFGKYPNGVWLVDCKKAVDLGFSIRDNKTYGHEDIDFYCQIINKCYFAVGFNWLNFRDDLTPNANFLNDGTNSNLKRYTIQQEVSYNTWPQYLTKYVKPKGNLPDVKLDRKAVRDHFKENGYMPYKDRINLFNEDFFNNKRELEPIKFEYKPLDLFDMMK